MLETVTIILSIVAAVIAVGAATVTIYVFQRSFRKSQKVDRITTAVESISGTPLILYGQTGRGLSQAVNEWRSILTKQGTRSWVIEPKDYTAPDRIEMIVEEKKQRFLNIPSISFHYANDEQIKDFYNEYFKEPTIENLVSEITGEVSGEIKGSLPQILESRIGSKDLNKWVSTIRLPEASLNGMFLRFQRETIKNNQVTLGIEEVDIELNELETFEEAIADLKEQFGLEIDEVILDAKRTHLKERAAEKTLTKLEQATGWVLIEGKFKIEHDGDFYRCTYLHPVNTYLSNQFGPITISVLIPQKSLKEHIKGNYAQSVGRSIPLKIYGQVWQPVDRKANILDLQLTPLAIY